MDVSPLGFLSTSDMFKAFETDIALGRLVYAGKDAKMFHADAIGVAATISNANNVSCYMSHGTPFSTPLSTPP